VKVPCSASLACLAGFFLVSLSSLTVWSSTYQLGSVRFDLHELEHVPPGEIEAINSTNELFDRFFATQYAKPTTDASTGLVIHGTRRGVHPRAHGCVSGTMEVLPRLWDQDQTPMFRPGSRYKVIARFSNADPRGSSSDATPDSRGLAIKIYDVRGDRVLPAGIDPERSEQVFSFNNTDRFFADDALRYRDFMNIALFGSSNFSEAATKYVIEVVKGIHLLTANRIRLAFTGIRDAKISNVLGLNYFSISAHQHGRGTSAPSVKYAMFPCEGAWYDPAEIDSKNPFFLRKNLQTHMKLRGACFVFAVQRNPEKRLGVEDLTQPWDASLAPFETIAKVHFPPQELTDAATCERETFNPWTSIEEHRPLGGINRMRLGSYLHSIQRRQR
jgi:catalase